MYCYLVGGARYNARVGGRGQSIWSSLLSLSGVNLTTGITASLLPSSIVRGGKGLRNTGLQGVVAPLLPLREEDTEIREAGVEEREEAGEGEEEERMPF